MTREKAAEVVARCLYREVPMTLTPDEIARALLVLTTPEPPKRIDHETLAWRDRPGQARLERIRFHMSALANLRAFAVERGWFEVPAIGEYEVLRLQGAPKGLLSVYRNDKTDGLCKASAGDEQPEARELIYEWARSLREKKP